jgi:hypothetical protein
LELQVYQRAAEPLLAPFIKYFEENPAPDWLAPLVEVAHVRPPILALATIAPVLDHIYQGQSRNDDDDDDDDEIDPREVGMLVKKDMGERLRSHLASKPMPKRLKADWKRLTDWDNEMRVRAGHWMMNAVPRIPSLRLNHLGAPEIVRARKIDVDALRDLMMRINQVFMPFTEEPPLDWTGFRKWYGGSFNRSFVRGVKGEHLDTKKLIHEAFESGFPHAHAVNALKRVPLMIDQRMVELVEKYAPRILNEDAKKRRFYLTELPKHRATEKTRVAIFSEAGRSLEGNQQNHRHYRCQRAHGKG